MLKSLFSIFILIFATFHLKSQKNDTIILMNGNYVVEKVIDTLIGAVTTVNPQNPKHKMHYEYDRIYCVKYANGFNDYYYSQDTLNGNYFTREEMQYYIFGERDARKGFKARGALIGSGISGLIGGGIGLFFAPILPYGFMAFSGLPKIKIEHHTISNPNYIDQNAYIFGYERVSRSKRRIQSLIGGTIGLALGYGLYFGILKYQLPETLKLRF